MDSNYKEWIDFLNNGLYHEEPIFIEFTFLWIAFNAYLNQRYTCDGDVAKIKKTKKDKKFKKAYKSFINNNSELIQGFHNTKDEGRDSVKDMRVGRSGESIFDKYNNSYSSFIDTIYQIRCNFIHGNKIPNDPDDKKLMEWAYDNFTEFFWTYILKES